MDTVVSLLGLCPIRVGVIEALVREISLQLAPLGWKHVAAFSGPPIPKVREYLDLPNLVLESVPSLGTRSLTELRHVESLIARYRPDIVHLHFLNLFSPLPWLVKARGTGRIFFTDHTSYPPNQVVTPSPAWKRAIGRVAHAPFDTLISVSEFNKQMRLQKGLTPPSRIRRIYNGTQAPALSEIPRLRFEFRKRHGIPQDAELVTQICWMIPEKGIEDLLDAAVIVLRARPHVRFLLGGEGHALESFRARAEALGISSSVTFTGMLEAPVADGTFAASDIFCHPCRWQEAFGATLIEAMGSSLPVVASGTGAIPEIVEDGVTGSLVPPSNPQAVARALLDLLEQPAKRERMGAAGRARMERLFSLPPLVCALLGCYGLVAEEPTMVSSALDEAELQTRNAVRR